VHVDGARHPEDVDPRLLIDRRDGPLRLVCREQ